MAIEFLLTLVLVGLVLPVVFGASRIDMTFMLSGYTSWVFYYSIGPVSAILAVSPIVGYILFGRRIIREEIRKI